MLFRLSIVVATLALVSADWREDSAIMTLEHYVNSFSNDMMYERVVGRPQIDIPVNTTPLIVNIKDASLASSSCLKSKVYNVHDYYYIVANCPVPQNARTMIECSATIVWQNDVPKIHWSQCKNPN